MTAINFTNMTNASSILSIMKEIDTSNFMAGWFIILALVGFLIVLTSNYDYKGAKAAFVLATFVCANIVGLLWLAGLAALFHLVMALALVVIAILVFFLTGD